MKKENLQKLVAVKPSARQLQWQQLEYYNFIHFGMNTITGNEWGDGKIPPSKFNFKVIDTDQWIRVLKESGSKGVIITAKHHDGFCLFQTKYTNYSIASSPYLGGKGDIVKQVADSCKKYDMKIGIYLSPWDRNNESYGTESYNDYFCNQLTELLTNYGEIFEVWFDGACGEGQNGKKQIYDFPRYEKLIRKLQPNAVIAVCGTDVRWIGNEGGKTRQAEWSVVSARLTSAEYTAALSQQNVEVAPMSSMDDDLGSREALKNEEQFVWYPAECDISIMNRGWFHSRMKEWMFGVRSLENLRNVYFNTVGGNASLLLNVPPCKRGVISKKVVERLLEFGKSIREDFKDEIAAKIVNYINHKGLSVYDIAPKTNEINYIVIQENIAEGQLIESFVVEKQDENGKLTKVYEGSVVGAKKIICLNHLKASKLRLTITQTRAEPKINKIILYK